MGYRLQVPGECEERISDSVAPEHLPGACQPSAIPRGAMGYRPQVPGECGERLSVSVAPEHLRGSCQPDSMPRGALPVTGTG
jgi:hypothetical protein